MEKLNYDVIGICETFLRDNDQLSLDDYTWYGKNRSHTNVRACRGSGGVGAFVHSRVLRDFSCEILDDSEDDILWLKLKSKETNFCMCLCICYLPPKGSSRTHEADVFYRNLLDQTNVYQNEGVICICGDFNSRCGGLSDYVEGVDDAPPRSSLDTVDEEYGDMFIEFLVDCNMCMLNGRVGQQNDFTFVSTRGKSVVDYVCLPHEQLSFCSDFKVHRVVNIIQQHDLAVPDKIPDHSLLEWTIQVRQEVVNEIDIETSNFETGYQRNNFPSATFLRDPESQTLITSAVERIEHSLQAQHDVDTAYGELVNLVKIEMDKKLKKTVRSDRAPKKCKSHKKPYWNEALQEQWRLVCDAETVWLQNKNTATKRRLRASYCQERRTFDRLNRKYRRAFQQSQQEELLKMSESRDSREFWREIGRVGIANTRRQRIPCEVVDDDGNVSSDPEIVLNRWRSDYEALYKGTASDEFDQAHLDSVQKQLRAMEADANIPAADATLLNMPISLQEVEAAVQRAKLRKACGIDTLPAEALKNPACVTILHKIISYCFEQGIVPKDWTRGVITPVPKQGNKDPRVPLNYRGITLISVPCKIYCDVLNRRLSAWLELNNVLVDEQNGFRSKRSCLDHLHTLYTIVNNRKRCKKETFACFIDATKAFDNVQRDCMWFKLQKLGLKGHIFRAVKSLYQDVQCAVRVNGRLTPWFGVRSGVKQGCLLSPTLFAIYVNDLAHDVKQLNCGIQVDNDNVSILLYADDIVLLAPCEQDLQRMLLTVRDWCRKWRMIINCEKTNIVHFRAATQPRSDFVFSVGDSHISYTSAYKYLGLWFNEHLDLKHTVRELAKSASRAFGALTAKFIACGGMAHSVYTKLFENLVQPVLLYGSAIWGLSEHGVINTVQNKACRLFLGVGRYASNIATRGDMGWSSCVSKQQLEAIRLWIRLRKMPGNRLTRRVHEWSNRRAKSWESRVRSLLSDLDMTGDLQNHSVRQTLNIAKQKLNDLDNTKWNRELWNDRRNPENGNKLRTYRRYKTALLTEPYVETLIPRHHRRVLAMLRCGSLPLAIETGRRTKTPLERRVCQFCPGTLEDETHFLIDCPIYSDIRYDLFYRAQDSDNSFTLMNSTQKLNFLMNKADMQRLLASTVYNMFTRRKVLDSVS